jgi:hypothetical protein
MDQDAQWREFVADHLRADTEHLAAIRSTLGVIAFVVVLTFLFGLLGVLVSLSTSGGI